MQLNLLALAALSLTGSHAAAATPGETCVQDLRAIAPFLLENDTGARQHLEQKGQAYFDLALATATRQVLRNGLALIGVSAPNKM